MVVSQRDKSGWQRTEESSSYEFGFQGSDEIDESESGVDGGFVESDEVLFGGRDELRVVS